MKAIKAMTAKLKLISIAAAFCLIFASKVGAAPTLNGIAIYEELGAEQFIAAVYSDTLTSSSRQLLLANENKAMEIRVLVEQLYSRRFKRMWVEGIAINAGATDLERHAQDLADFTKIIRVKLKQGDNLRIARIMGKGTVIYINGLELGSINNTRFFDLLLRTWVGPVPLSSDFKQTMLANGHIPKRILKRFEATSPTPARVVSLTKALKSEKNQKPPVKPSVAESSPKPGSIENLEPKPKTSSSESTNKPTELAKVDPPKLITIKQPEKPIKTVATIPKIKPSTKGGVFGDDVFDDDVFDDNEGQDEPFSAESLLSEQLYISKLTKWTGQFVKYPRYSINHNQEGTVRVTVMLSRRGKVKDVEVTDKSVHEQLNKAAKKAIKQASPYPSMPDDVKGDVFRFTVPVVFRLN